VRQQWIERPEGGTLFGLRFIRSFTLFFGRTAGRVMLVPITLYFFIRRGPERRASRAYLSRILGREATSWEVAKHIYTFATVTLDRVFFLSGKYERFDVRMIGVDCLRERWRWGRGVLVFGAHVGSFDALRAMATLRQDVTLRVVLDVEQNPTLSRVLNTLNPKLAASIINARQEGTTTALAIKEALDERSIVTLLVDRARPGNAVINVDFLGAPAPFPTAPWQLAAALKVPVVLCFGLYMGGNRYDLHFEEFEDTVTLDRKHREAELRRLIERFADRLAHHVRSAPYNWFNFYEFWQMHPPKDPPQRHADDMAVRGTSESSR
jgi:predicted LPLAT superfamily acyltransferase